MFNIRNILGLGPESADKGNSAKDESDKTTSNLSVANVTYTSVIKFRSKQNHTTSRTFETYAKCRSKYEDYQELDSLSGI